MKLLSKELIIAIHSELLAEHGGAVGVANNDLLESTLAKPLHHLSYGDPDLPVLAASYGYGFTKNHCFVDGNKRIALASIGVFLLNNGLKLIASEESAVDTIYHVAKGVISEDELINWITENIQDLDLA